MKYVDNDIGRPDPGNAVDFDSVGFPLVDGPDALEEFDFDSFLHLDNDSAYGHLGEGFEVRHDDSPLRCLRQEVED
jgi:hypothetical protein